MQKHRRYKIGTHSNLNFKYIYIFIQTKRVLKLQGFNGIAFSSLATLPTKKKKIKKITGKTFDTFEHTLAHIGARAVKRWIRRNSNSPRKTRNRRKPNGILYV